MRVRLLALLLLTGCTEKGALELVVPEGILSGTVDVTVKGAADRLSVLVDDASLGGGAGPAFTVSWDTTTVADGAHTVTGLADFGDGEPVETSREVEVLNTVDAPPVVAFTSPTDGATLDSGDVEILLEVTDDVGVATVAVYADDVALADFPQAWPYQYTWTGAAEGEHTLRAEVTDTAAHGASAAVAFTVDPSITCSITRPRDGGTISGVTTVTVAAAAEGRVESVVLSIDGVEVGTDTASPWSIDADVSDRVGDTVTLSIVATGTGGATCTDTITATVAEDSGFDVEITAPSDGGTVSGASVPVRAAIGGGGGADSAELYVDGVLTATDDASDWAFAWDSTASADGAHTIEVVGYETGTGASASDSISVTVSNAR